VKGFGDLQHDGEVTGKVAVLDIGTMTDAVLRIEDGTITIAPTSAFL